MEGGLGSTRMGSRSSTRHGPASVFQGRVRRWHKSWAPVISSPSPATAASRVLLYKWTPITLPTTNGTKESTPEEPAPTKALRFMPVEISLLDSYGTISEVIVGSGMEVMLFVKRMPPLLFYIFDRLLQPVRLPLLVAVLLQDREEEARKAAEETGTLAKLEQEVQVAYALIGESEASLPQDATAPAGGAGDVGNGSNEEALDVFKPGDGCGEGDKVQGSREAHAELQGLQGSPEKMIPLPSSMPNSTEKASVVFG